jgi:very-short-patch-repair endonuclease
MDLQIVSAPQGARVSREWSALQVLIRLLSEPPFLHFRFEQRVGVGRHVADVMCRERGCVILLMDGDVMTRTIERARDEAFLRAGYAVFRVPVDNLDGETAALRASLQNVLEGRVEEFVEGAHR